MAGTLFFFGETIRFISAAADGSALNECVIPCGARYVRNSEIVRKIRKRDFLNWKIIKSSHFYFPFCNPGGAGRRGAIPLCFSQDPLRRVR